ncbi:MAG: septum formation initiator family protein, partial [Tenericutes bacterium]|nr:septum formation initiator family protein [Mycoplasmatota bacterium]
VTYSEKLTEEETLKSEINKLKDPEYMARYAREKYLYSKNDEIIIKIEE